MSDTPVSGKKMVGALLVLVPLPLLVTILAGYAIASFVIAQTESVAAGNVMRMVLGFGGILALVGILAIPIGIYLLVKRDDKFLHNLRRHAAYEHMSEGHLQFVTGASLGAFLNPFVWAMGNHLYWWAMGMFVPLWGLYVWIRLIVDGRRLSWEKGWSNFTHFQESQKTLLQVIGLMILIEIVIPLVIMFLSTMIPALLTSVGRSSLESSDGSSSFSQESTPSCSLREDTDRDLLTDFEERVTFKTDPEKADTDGDGFDDFSELLHGYDPDDQDIVVMADEDEDGLSDGVERKIFSSDREDADTDGDGVNDGQEVANGFSPTASSEPLESITAARQAELADYDATCAQK